MKLTDTKNYLLLAIIFLAGFNSYSHEANRIELDGIDITEAVQFFDKQTSRLSQPVTVFNWSVQTKDDDSKFEGRVQKSSQIFWNGFGQKAGMHNLFGDGLYAAVDPVITESYGSRNKTWLLSKMVFPAGFKLMDLTVPIAVPSSVQNILSQFQCPLGVDNFFQVGGALLTESCQKIVRKIFQEQIKIDAFAYIYSQTHFKVCKEGDAIGEKAFVVTDSAWMNQKNITYYTAKSVKNREDRILIQTSFFEAMDDNSTELITALGSTQTARGRLLWSDLNNQPKDAKIKEWLKENKFGCNGTLPYQN